MSKHEQYEELCTLAMIGEVSSAEMQDLRQHLSQCADCREQYREFTQFLLPQLSISSDNDATFETGYSAVEKARLRKSFLAAAQRKGRVFSAEAVAGTTHTAVSPVVPAALARAPRYRWAVAACIVALLLYGSGYETHLIFVQPKLQFNRMASAPRTDTANHGANPANDAAVRLHVADDQSAQAIAELRQKLSATVSELQETQHSLQISQADQSALQSQLSQKSDQITALQSEALGSQQRVAELRSTVVNLQQRINDSQSAAAASQLRIRDLSEQLSSQSASLDRERQMLSVGRDVRDLMGARNLHIIDVHDANGAGRNKQSFGRIFYTEGKSLIFYAFDLDDKGIANASYSYQAWGERLGQPSSVKSLGILYADDKAQRRWSLKVNDPHQLAEINTVFVTLEPHAGEGGKPQGKRILFAFLGGEANHP